MNYIQRVKVLTFYIIYLSKIYTPFTQLILVTMNILYYISDIILTIMEKQV